ncbi:hypothetical protein TNIN_340611 [Trichonephila inaurata madagascariensis]|uniref:Cytochrome P450 n=1 Tax=Trichonephila inaurata madagascariensis TaxID=2747483 RepID=A0A8X6XJS1_9ARAC|nr:hypothetical protein TNIN_340611 [Trichonephila inaurata madagascariensis]
MESLRALAKCDSHSKTETESLLRITLGASFERPIFHRRRRQSRSGYLRGYDTTAMALSWALYCLGRHPEIQQKVQEELDGIFEDDIDRNIVRQKFAMIEDRAGSRSEKISRYFFGSSGQSINSQHDDKKCQAFMPAF